MARGPSRRRVLAACGAVAASVPLGWAAIEETIGTTNAPASAEPRPGADEWPMAQHDPAGTSYAPDASGPKDGVRVRWKRRVETGRSLAYRPGPVVADGLVYGVDGELVCVEAASGEVVFRADRQYARSPAVVAARAYRSPTLAFAAPDGVVGLHAGGGRSIAGVRVGLQRWHRETGGARPLPTAGGPPLAVPVGTDGTAFLAETDALYAIDASSGRVRWRERGGDHRPAIRDGTVYVGSYGDELRGYDTETGERTFSAGFSTHRSRSITAAPGGLVVGTAGGLVGVGYDGVIDWEYVPADRYLEQETVAVADGVAYARIEDEQLEDRLVAVDTTDGTERWHNRAALDSPSGRTPLAVADGVVYLPTAEGIAGIDAADGHRRWTFAPGGDAGPWSSAALVDDTLYTLGGDYLYALVEA